MRKFYKYAALLLVILFMPLPVFASGENASYSKGDGPFTVVLDPGHGGDDLGAVGPSGIEEKNVTLAIALKAAEEIKAKLGCRVLLTRTEDVFIPLEERVGFANRNQADIFISVHANSTISREVNGIETFFLSFEATDEDARRIAAFENNITINGKPAYASSEPDDLKDILLDLAKTESHHESSMLAEAVHTSMVTNSNKENRGIKQAPFVVLIGATMPAILVEVGFISNPKEEKRLVSKKTQSRIASSLTEGVAGFKKITAKGTEYIGFNRYEKE